MNDESNQPDVTNKRYALGTPVKMVSSNRVGGYLVRFTSDKEPDLHGEYFTGDTNFYLDTYPVAGSPILYNHGFDELIAVKGIGRIDTVKLDAQGIYAEGSLTPEAWGKQQIEQSEAYLSEIKKLIERGRLGWSSGALPQSVRTSPDGLITDWAIIEGSLTTTPAAGLHQTQVFAAKSLMDYLRSVSDAPKEHDAIEVVKSDTPQTEVPKPKYESSPESESKPEKGINKMDTSKLREALTAAIERVLLDAEGVMSEDDDMSKMNDDEKAAKEAAEEVVTRATEIAKSAAAVAGMGDDIDYGKLASRVVEQHGTEFIKSYVEGIVTRHQARRAATRKAINDAKTSVQKSAPAQSRTEPVTRHRVQVGESMKYAHISDEQLALGIQLAAASIPPHMRNHAKLSDLGHVFSEDFLRTAAHRVSKSIDSATPKDNSEMAVSDYNAMKSARPFKADELNATDITNQGLEWLSVYYDTRLWERARDNTALFDELVSRGMRTVTIPQGSKTMNVKLNTGSGTVHTAPEANDLDATGRPEVVSQITPFQTAEVEKSAAKHILAQAVTYELEEDSIINVTSFLNDDMATTLAEALEDALLNGDTTTAANTNINLIDGTPATGLATPLYIAWDGIRHNALIEHTAFAVNASGTLDITTFNTVLSAFPKALKQRKNNLLFVINSETEDQVRVFPELLTMDTAGQQRATMFTGDLNANPLFKVQLYTSGFLYQANTAGKISATPANNVTGTILGIYAPYWQYGRKRAVTIETDRQPLSQTMVMVASVRHAFAARGAGASVIAYNVRN